MKKNISLISVSKNLLELIISERHTAKLVKLKRPFELPQAPPPSISRIYCDSSYIAASLPGGVHFASAGELTKKLSGHRSPQFIVFSDNLNDFSVFTSQCYAHFENIFVILVYGDRIVSLPALSDSGWPCFDVGIKNLARRYPALVERIKRAHKILLNEEQVAGLLDAIITVRMLRNCARSLYHPHYAIEIDLLTGKITKFYLGGITSASDTKEAPGLCALAIPHFDTQICIEGFQTAYASISIRCGTVEGAAVDIDFERASIRATYECLERATLKDVQGELIYSSAKKMGLDTTVEWKMLLDACPLSVRDEVGDKTIPWISTLNVRDKSIYWLPACLFSTDASTRVWKGQHLAPQGAAAHKNRWMAKHKALLEMVERDAVPKIYAKRNFVRINPEQFLSNVYLRISASEIHCAVYAATYAQTPIVLAFVYDHNYLGCTGQSAGMTLPEATDSALLNALGVYQYKKARTLLDDVRGSWCFDLKEEPDFDWVTTANFECLISHYAPFICDLSSIFSSPRQDLAVAAAWSSRAINGYTGNVDFLAEFCQLSSDEKCVLEREGNYINLEVR